MTGTSHSILNAAVTYTVTHSPWLAFIAAATAHIPDWMEKFFPLSEHRSWTHIILGWGVLAWFAHTSGWSPLAQTIICSCLLHVLADALSVMGVPLILPGWGNIHLCLYKTGRLSELFVLLTMIIGIGCIWWYGLNLDGYKLPAHTWY